MCVALLAATTFVCKWCNAPRIDHMTFDWLTATTQALLIKGVWITLLLTTLSTVFALLIGVWMGTVRLSGSRFGRITATLFINIHRNIPALVLIIFWAFAFPNLFSAETRQALFFNNAIVNQLTTVTGLAIPYYAIAALLGLTLNASGYIAELFRAGVGTIAQQHLQASRTLGATQRETYWLIVVPEGIRASFPAISTRLIHTMKNTALASFVAVPEFFHATQTAINNTFQAVQFLLLASVVYLLLTYLYTLLLRTLEHQLNPRSKRPSSRFTPSTSHA